MTTPIDVTSPAEQGVDARGIAAFVQAVEAHPGIEPHGLIVQRHGARIAEGHWAPHDGSTARLVYSLSKTFTGTALALALGEGRLTLDDPVVDHLPELFGEADDRTKRLLVRHIASMATGHDRETFGEVLAIDPADPVRAFFTIPPDAEPGTLFAYNQPPVLALAAVLQRLTGERLTDYLRTRVLDPIGITDLRWAQLVPGLDTGFSGVHTTLDAIARLGQLHLDDGVWDGERLLPDGWVAQASTAQVANPNGDSVDWRQGYGFQLWRSQHGYRGDGAFGQYMVVLPQHDAVVAMFSSTYDMQAVLDAMWEHLLPAMTDDAHAPTGHDRVLADRLARLALPTAGERLSGGEPAPTTMTFAPHPASTQRTVSSITATPDAIVLHEADGTIEVPVSASWSRPASWLAASATRLTEGRLVLDLVFTETPHRLEVELDEPTATFRMRWPVAPLRPSRLTSLRAPAT